MVGPFRSAAEVRAAAQEFSGKVASARVHHKAKKSQYKVLSSEPLTVPNVNTDTHKKLYKDKEYIESFQFITQGMADIFINDDN